MPTSLSIAAAAGIIATGIVFDAIWRRKKRSQSNSLTLRAPSLKDLTDGPKPKSWLGGGLLDILQGPNIGNLDQEWVETHGQTFNLKGSCGENMLYLADPKGLHYVLDTSTYTFNRGIGTQLVRMILGPSILAAEGAEHARHKKILVPGFTQAAAKNLIPSFMQVCEKLINRWVDVCQSGSPPHVVDLNDWMSRLTLDAIGEGAFSYDFGALGDNPSEFMAAYRALFVEALKKPELNSRQMLGLKVLPYIPMWVWRITERLFLRTPISKNFMTTSRKISTDILHRELEAAEGQLPQGKDVLSVLVRANLIEDPSRKMSEEELLSQTMVLTIAGHDTTSNTLMWLFYELAMHPNIQNKVREEINDFRGQSGSRDLTPSDFESLPYTTAVIKETLRFYPVGPHAFRWAGRDEIIPLSKPVKTKSGEESYEVSIKEGEPVLISICGYNRLKELWGDDAQEWNPARFMGERLAAMPKHSLGVYSNLATFSSGVQSCIGWRFAIFEMYAVVISLLEKFEFGPPPDGQEVIRGPLVPLIPVIKGKEKDGAKMPLTIRCL